MKIEIKETIAEKMGWDKFKFVDMDQSSWSWRDVAVINLALLSTSRIRKLRKLFDDSDVWGTGTLVRDIDKWLKVIDGDEGVKPRSCSQFCDLLVMQMAQSDGHRMYKREEDGTMLCYYVNEVTYHPPQRSRDYSYPAHTIIELMWKEFDQMHEMNIEFQAEDCRGMTISEAMIRKGLEHETPELRETYLQEKKRFIEVAPNIGGQFMAIGTSTDDVDGNGDNQNRWFGSNVNLINMVNNGNPTRCVIDVFFEEEQEKKGRRSGRVELSSWFWDKKRQLAKDEDIEDYDEMEDDFGDDYKEEAPEIEVPIHPYMAIFDMSKHRRMRCHLNNLTEYVYDRDLGRKLVVPKETQSLVKMLINHETANYEDIIRGKTGGAVVLLAGRPGVGKTLTAEVYAEAEARPLYSIQCSQLGTDPDDLEDELLKVFTRARRWNAIMLLDEADVYVRARGEDLQQNAIVGVFLRVLEYQSSILFLTTNRPDSVDDAIASRCIAKVVYDMPTDAEHRRIWEVLTSTTGVKINKKTIDEIVSKGSLSGRDVKNLLKLCMLMEPGKPISAKTVEFVKRFKPSGS